jgi:hypothetical protein
MLHEASLVVECDSGDALTGKFLPEMCLGRSGLDRFVDLSVGQVGRFSTLFGWSGLVWC